VRRDTWHASVYERCSIRSGLGGPCVSVGERRYLGDEGCEWLKRWKRKLTTKAKGLPAAVVARVRGAEVGIQRWSGSDPKATGVCQSREWPKRRIR
jgi:hypothetical protein